MSAADITYVYVTTSATCPVLFPVTKEACSMKSRAAVAWEAKKPLTIETIEIGGPKRRRGAGRDHGDRRVPHRRLHACRASIRRASSRRSSAMRAPASCARSAPASPR